MPAAPAHHCRVLLSPWAGLYATETCSGRHYGRHSHGTYGFGVLQQGAHRSSSDRRSFDAYAGDILATNPGEMHDGRPLGGPTRHWHTVYLEPALLSSVAGLAGEVRITQAAFADGELRGAVRRLVAALEQWQQGAGEALACEEALVTACGLLVARHTTAPPMRAAAVSLQQARRRLGEELVGPPSLAELAAEAGVSRFQFLRRFAQVHGCTPHAWLTQQRCERARGLVAGGLPLADAAAACGFADQAHMTRLFARQFGFTPGAWQRAHRVLQ
ncbi:AraC family transcriptional regulator [Ramlibacter sp. USB13]|uniref:AraC family transcriptional regulator n=1 Tax=Ramlibacter cellulosilyticus TaxID=2764187 RepID=A0A923S9X2_9BURK|nr:AraC family transcriptional regulator [Ramlibacter cellulosilyticus]MBC5782126.1 AraC family transcriptional regulator [Ramlibacter cellulosilyticus]